MRYRSRVCLVLLLGCVTIVLWWSSLDPRAGIQFVNMARHYDYDPFDAGTNWAQNQIAVRTKKF
jgi:hypothetical protein